MERVHEYYFQKDKLKSKQTYLVSCRCNSRKSQTITVCSGSWCWGLQGEETASDVWDETTGLCACASFAQASVSRRGLDCSGESGEVLWASQRALYQFKRLSKGEEGIWSPLHSPQPFIGPSQQVQRQRV